MMPNANEYDVFGYERFRAIPYTSEDSDVKGIQMMIIGKANKKFQIINLLSSESTNNVFKYKSDIIKYGHQRFYNIETSNQTAIQSYYTYFAAELEPSFIEEKNLDHCERHIVTKTIMDQIL